MKMEVDSTSSSVKQYVVFQLQNEAYGIDIQLVQGIEKIKNIARVPKAPQCIVGVMNLRGEIIPVMSLRARFNIERKAYDDNTRIIIIRLEDSQIGLIVDEVKEVLELGLDAIENIQGIDNTIDLDYIAGVGKIQEGSKVITLLNLQTLIEQTLM